MHKTPHKNNHHLPLINGPDPSSPFHIKPPHSSIIPKIPFLRQVSRISSPRSITQSHPQSSPIIPPMSSASIPVSSSSSSSQQSTHQPPSFPLPSFRSIYTRLSGFSRHALSNRRPWTELIDRTSFTRPVSFSDAASRVRKNAAYFRVNYLIVIAAVLAYSLLSHPFTLLTMIGLAAAWIFFYSHRQSDQPLEILGQTYSDTQVLFGLGLVTLIAILVTSVLSLLITALTIGVGIVCAHGAFRDPEDLFLDESQPLGAGFASMFSGAASSAGASVMSRV